MLVFAGILLLTLIGIITYYIITWPSKQETVKEPPKKSPRKIIVEPEDTRIEPISFVPSEARIVVQKSSYSNKFNDIIGNFDSGLAPGAIGVPEIVIPSDWYMFRTPPTEFDGPYWPSGTIQPDFIYPGGRRPLRSQNLYASQIISF